MYEEEEVFELLDDKEHLLEWNDNQSEYYQPSTNWITLHRGE